MTDILPITSPLPFDEIPEVVKQEIASVCPTVSYEKYGDPVHENVVSRLSSIQVCKEKDVKTTFFDPENQETIIGKMADRMETYIIRLELGTDSIPYYVYQVFPISAYTNTRDLVE